MKSIFYRPLLLALISSFILLSCKKNIPELPELFSIEVKNLPAKVDYYASELLNLEGLVIMLTMDNGETEDVFFSDFDGRGITTSPENGALLNESTNVLITDTLSGINASLAVSVSSVALDIDGNTYTLVRIGDQLWTGENLKTTRYSDGSSIPYEENDIIWNSLSTDAYCWFDNNKDLYADTYGALYNWYAVDTDKLCPSGWHVPSDEEWIDLVNFLGGEDVAGGKLKETGTTHWSAPNEGASNSSGFTGLPAGSRSDLFHSLGDGARWWSSTQYDEFNAWALSVTYTYASTFLYNYTKSQGYSVRCIRDY